ncbi:aldehyde dehydrogenase family protein [Conexibacter sp. SYSU D00693]|uniref:aldehyde dehydrogenase family protein n=1 Tax=Conexibacter sp. SYSU D00693 TaxID=2812560 RepID=UPI00196AEAF2|nr:aldehyde dehydrogenase family protein [Conexibacter sp. SYSU D00693]
MTAFVNEPTLELRRAAERERLTQALAELDADLPLRFAVRIGGDRRDGDDLVSTDPARPDRLVAVGPAATEEEARVAVRVAAAAAPAWSRTPVAERAAALQRAAAWLRERRPRLAALCVRETAKPWPEADADVCEAIDFLEFYAREAVALDAGPALLQVPGERNALRYVARGVVAVVAPWNFPIAIPMGMVAAALATGNAVVLKPAEQSPGCGAVVVDALRAAGVPDDVLALVPGDGAIGAALVGDPGVHAVAFTGSSAVGLEILRTAATVAAGQRHLKHCVIEMGGKNCVIVDSDADLDDAVPGIVRSAFPYAGQKCSAAGRVLVHEAVHDALLERLAGAVEVLQVGPADAFGTDVPPVVEREARERLERLVAEAGAAGRISARHAAVPDDGHYVAPTLLSDLPADAAILHEEVFGPVLTVEPVAGVEEACDRVDALPFALTGGLFSRDPRTVARVVERSPVGNLYVNRPITGAMVGRQPFGGNRLSGTGTKAGGPDYLRHFVEPRVVTESTIRHGLVVPGA